MPQEEEKLQEVGTIYETKTPQETRHRRLLLRLRRRRRLLLRPRCLSI